MTTKRGVKPPSWKLERLDLSDWRRYREIRLRALRESPHAFGSTAAEAEQLSVAAWKKRLARRTTFLATAGDRSIGLASGIAAEAPSEAELISMWVDPDWRGRGVGGALVEAVAQWARVSGYRRLRLWVADGNRQAEHLYRACRFARSGETQPLGHGRGDRMEFGMVRLLGDRLSGPTSGGPERPG